MQSLYLFSLHFHKYGASHLSDIQSTVNTKIDADTVTFVTKFMHCVLFFRINAKILMHSFIFLDLKLTLMELSLKYRNSTDLIFHSLTSLSFKMSF